MTGMSGISNTIVLGSKATGSSSVTLTNSGVFLSKNSSQTLLTMASSLNSTGVLTSTSTSTSTSIAQGSGLRSSVSSSPSAKASNVAHIVDAKVPTVVFLMG